MDIRDKELETINTALGKIREAISDSPLRTRNKCDNQVRKISLIVKKVKRRNDGSRKCKV